MTPGRSHDWANLCVTASSDLRLHSREHPKGWQFPVDGLPRCSALVSSRRRSQHAADGRAASEGPDRSARDRTDGSGPQLALPAGDAEFDARIRPTTRHDPLDGRQSYDGAVISALAAEEAKGTDPRTFASHIRYVTTEANRCAALALFAYPTPAAGKKRRLRRCRRSSPVQFPARTS